MSNEIILHIDLHHGEERLFAQFPYNSEINRKIRTIPGARWSQRKKQWHFNVNRQVVELLSKELSSLSVINTIQLKQQLIERKKQKEEKQFKELHAETIAAIKKFQKWNGTKAVQPENCKELRQSYYPIFTLLFRQALYRAFC